MKKLTTVFLLALVAALGGVAVAGTSKAKNTSGTAWVGVTHSENGVNFVSGDVKDKVLGRGAIVYQVTIREGEAPQSVEITAKKITLYTSKGTLSGTGSATQTTAADGQSATLSNGKIKLTKGSGDLRGKSLTGTFDGTFANGVYTFKYKGTIK